MQCVLSIIQTQYNAVRVINYTNWIQCSACYQLYKLDIIQTVRVINYTIQRLIFFSLCTDTCVKATVHLTISMHGERATSKIERNNYIMGVAGRLKRVTRRQCLWSLRTGRIGMSKIVGWEVAFKAIFHWAEFSAPRDIFFWLRAICPLIPTLRQLVLRQKKMSLRTENSAKWKMALRLLFT